VYEVIRIIDGNPLFLEDHVERLVRSASLSGCPFLDTAGGVREQIAELTAACGIVSGNIRIVYGYAGNTPDTTCIAYFVRGRYPDADMYRTGVRIGLLPGERSSPGIKRSNTPVRKRADIVLARGELYEVILVADGGFMTEGSRNNIFFVEDNTLVTPPARDVLPGITRGKVFDIARREDIGLVERPVNTSDIGGFDALFLTGTSAKVLPVRSVDDVPFSVNNPLMRRVITLYERLIESYLNAPGGTA